MKILIIHQGALGDMVILFPILINLKNFGICHLICKSQLSNFAVFLKIVHEAYAIENKLFASFFSQEKKIEAREFVANYDCILIFSFSKDLKENIKKLTDARVFQINPRPHPSKKIHVTEYLFEKLKNIHLFKDIDINFHKIYPRPKSKNKCNILIHPGSGSKRKNWPLKKFIGLCKVLKQNDCTCQWIVGPAEIDLLANLNELNEEVHMPENLIELANLIKKANVFIGNDSGVTHLSAFLGIPTFAIFGPSDPLRWRPIGAAVEVINKNPGCQACFETDNNNCEGFKCMEEITVEDVLKTFTVKKWLSCRVFKRHPKKLHPGMN